MVLTRTAVEYVSTKDKREREYTPSTTEVLMEDLMRSFGTEMGQAYANYLNGNRLVRLSQPVAVTHKATGKKRVLQAQYTKFSRLGYDHAVGIYNEAANPDPIIKGVGELQQAVEKRMRRGKERFDPFAELTQSQYVPDLHVHRFGKALYFAAFDVEGDVDPEMVEPFTIHEYGSFAGKLPAIHMEFRTEPWFVRHNISREDLLGIEDSLVISFPQMGQEHERNMSNALALHPLDKLDRNSLGTIGTPFAHQTAGRDFDAMYVLSPTIPRELAMALIGRYLQNALVG